MWSASFRRIFRAFACTVVPDASAFDEPGWVRWEGLVQKAIGDRPPEMQRRLRVFLQFVQWSAVFRHGRPFTSLDAQKRASFLASLENHPVQLIRLGFWGLRTLAMLGYYGQPEIARAIGYLPDARGWEARR